MEHFRLPVPPRGGASGMTARRRVLLWGVTAAAALLVAADAGLPAPERVDALRSEWPRTTAYMELRRAEARRAGRKLEIAWEPVPLSRIPDHLERAVLVAEDAGFYGHHGFDLAELRAALTEAWRERRAPRGASTITMQLARNLWLSPEATLWRKLREAILARRLEAALGKRRILELYLNVVELGPGIFGVQAASRAYWGVPVEGIGPLRASELAATLPSPRRNNPRTRTRAFLWRRDLVAARTRADTAEADRLRASPPEPGAGEVQPPVLDTVALPVGATPRATAPDTTPVDTSAVDSIRAPADTGADTTQDTADVGTPNGFLRVSGPEAPPPRARPRAPAGRRAPTSPPGKARSGG